MIKYLIITALLLFIVTTTTKEEVLEFLTLKKVSENLLSTAARIEELERQINTPVPAPTPTGAYE